MPADPLLHFRLSEGKGNSVADAVDSKRKGNVKGKAKWVKSKFDQGLQFDGSNFVDLGNLADFERSDSFSYGGWIQVEPNAGGALRPPGYWERPIRPAAPSLCQSPSGRPYG